ncbi:very long chain fatty acid elongase AAEL008004-like [Atheta coriaria]|uniref:very long chain fatty acid elongase AAEL008004-like n=1 Tax=Dalotia coriaria TaxID=877792 RepID=UPI0031F45686
MSLVFKYMGDINRFINKYADPRTSHLPLISSPFYTLGICISYVIIVKYIGPKLMENRKPLNLKNTLIFYNFLQVLLSAYIFYEIGAVGWLTGRYSYRCEPVDYSNSPNALRAIRACYMYYLSKFTEFIDTLFFVLRKKNDQISTLHVIHHGIMPMSVWFGVKFTPGGHSMFFGFLNTFVHIVMYTYYMLSACGPSVQKYLWWKKYLTTMQMVQFVAIVVHAFQLLFIDCNYPRAFVWWIGMHGILFFFLFKQFYEESYLKRSKGAAALAATAAAAQNKEKNGKKHEPKEKPTTNGHVKNGYQNGVQNGVVKEKNGVHQRQTARDYYINSNGDTKY